MVNALKSVFNFYSLEDNLKVMLLIIVAFSVSIFFLSVVLSLITAWYNKQKRLLLIATQLIPLFMGISVSINNSYFLSAYLILLCFDIFSITVNLCLPQKKVKKTHEQKELIKYIDEQIHQPEQPTLKPILDRIILTKNPIEQTKQEQPEVDFSHVGGILERLEIFPLSANEKKQVNNLRATLLQAQNGQKDLEVKQRLNDGLSDLLKIMSKYSV